MLDVYTGLTGRPALLPIWGFGFTFVANQWIDQFALVDEAMGFRDHGIPCDVMGLEPANCHAEDYNSMAKKGLLRHIEPGQVVETSVRLEIV